MTETVEVTQEMIEAGWAVYLKRLRDGCNPGTRAGLEAIYRAMREKEPKAPGIVIRDGVEYTLKISGHGGSGGSGKAYSAFSDPKLGKGSAGR